MEGRYCYFAKNLLLRILEAHNDHVLPQENNIAVTAKWPWVLPITCFSMYTLLVTVFIISLVLLLLGMTVVVRKRGTAELPSSQRWKIDCTLQKLRYLQSLPGVFLLQQLPSTFSFVLVLTISQVISFRISGDLPLPKFWLLANSQSLSSYLWIYLQAYEIYFF